MPSKLSKEEFVNKAKKVYGNRYDYSKVIYKDTKTKIIVTCPVHGDFLVTPNNFLHGHKCPSCSNRQRITKEVFIERSNEIHNHYYDYSKVNYVNSETPVTIICPIHGDFLQKPKLHMQGCRCQKCYGTPKSNTSEFISKAKKIYGEMYDYSRVVYKGNKQKVKIICPIHGEWMVTPNNFLKGSRCPKCYGTPKYTDKQFVSMSKKIHGNKYDYSKVHYDGLRKKVKIICPIHGEFLQIASSHLKGCGCPTCSGYQKITKDTFVKRSIENHIIKYDYSKVKDINGNEKVCIICPTHGEFWQNPKYHMHGGNCPKCVGGVKLTTKDFIEKAKLIHKNKYDYSKVKYINYSTKVCIVCPEHGEFWQTPNNHLFGAGCPSCPQSNLEGEMRNFLIKNDISFLQEHSFDWLKFKKKMYLDFYLPDYNIAIECQGAQHFRAVDLFGGEDFYQKTIERDLIKNELCKKHGINILYFSNADVDYPYSVIESYSVLLRTIKNLKD